MPAVPTTPETLAAAMDPWEAANGPDDLWHELVAAVGDTEANRLWAIACGLYDEKHAA
ncbi:hypothetical protein [Streptomyces synnematoformans]|uniref:Uncharacterized protein n=1 Tax=Streptomyces synnematoformans TaxID=415721 RepID=A0ABN2X9Y2_9ACTN